MNPLLSGSADAIHASHAPGSTARAKADALASVTASIDADERARATANLSVAASLLATAAGIVNDPTAGTVLTGTATFLASVNAQIGSGSTPAGVLGRGEGVTPLPSFDVGVALTALLNAEGELELNGGGSARASLPFVDGLVNLALEANENGLDWGLGVALPFASGVTFDGAVTGDLAGARAAQMTLGWAYQREVSGT